VKRVAPGLTARDCAFISAAARPGNEINTARS
jgi:hypothetical protein